MIIKQIQFAAFFCENLVNIFSLPSSGEVKRIYEAKWSCTSSTTWSQVTQKVTPELCLFVDATQENLLIFVFKGEVQSLCGEVSDDVSGVTTPVGQYSLFLWDTYKAIYHTCSKQMRGWWTISSPIKIMRVIFNLKTYFVW